MLSGKNMVTGISAGDCGSYGSTERPPLPRHVILPPWYCIHVHPRMEDLAIKHLDYQGFKTFLPVMPAIVGRRGKQQQVERPLFPGYLFVTFDLDIDPWHAILSTIGVKHLFRKPSGYPAQMPPAVMKLAREQSIPLRQEIKVNDVAYVLAGPFAAQQGICTLADNQRVNILLRMLGQELNVSFPRNAVSKSTS